MNALSLKNIQCVQDTKENTQNGVITIVFVNPININGIINYYVVKYYFF